MSNHDIGVVLCRAVCADACYAMLLVIRVVCRLVCCDTVRRVLCVMCWRVMMYVDMCWCLYNVMMCVVL